MHIPVTGGPTGSGVPRNRRGRRDREPRDKSGQRDPK